MSCTFWYGCYFRQFNFQALFFCFWCTCSLQELWFPHQSCWRFRSSELLHHVIMQTVTNIWKDHLRLLYPQDFHLQPIVCYTRFVSFFEKWFNSKILRWSEKTTVHIGTQRLQINLTEDWSARTRLPYSLSCSVITSYHRTQDETR